MKTKKFTQGTLREKLKQCFKEGYVPLTMDEAVFRADLNKRWHHDEIIITRQALINNKPVILSNDTDFDNLQGEVCAWNPSIYSLDLFNMIPVLGVKKSNKGKPCPVCKKKTFKTFITKDTKQISLQYNYCPSCDWMVKDK